MKSRLGALFPLGLAVCVVQLSACATITRTEHADWKVDTIPQGAALAASNGGHCDATPCTLFVRRRESFTATLTKDGYRPMTVDVKPSLTPEGGFAFAGNVLIGGLIGMGIDYYTGAALDPRPAGTPFRLSPVAYASDPQPQALFKPAPSRAATPAPAPSPSLAATPRSASTTAMALAPRSTPIPSGAPAGVATRASNVMALTAPVDCPPDKAKYAAFLGVPCASLGGVMGVMAPPAKNR